METCRKDLYSLRLVASNFKGITMALLQFPRLLISAVRNAILLCNNTVNVEIFDARKFRALWTGPIIFNFRAH